MQEQTKDNIDFFAYEALRAFALTHNYNKWIYEIFRPYIGNRILEVGCGTGNLTKYFFNSCKHMIGIDSSSFFLKHLQIDHPELELYNFDITDDKILSLSNKNIDTIASVNVLEHVKDEEKALSHMYNLLTAGGHLLLFVPALSWLFGSLDENAKHYRRYNKKSLKQKLEKIGFKVEDIFFSNFLGIFGWFINGKILKRKTFPIVQPILFDKFVPLLTKFEKNFRIPVGMNLIAIAKKI
ncbi:MAG: class I SAM-dependent methyltransferase [Elusimicrobia bacterium]|nr:class I SAM-dependent methyltransferase [Elusimicrobiota bacterium]